MRLFDNYYNKPIREIEIHMDDKNMMIVGIPIQETLYKIIKHKN